MTRPALAALILLGCGAPGPGTPGDETIRDATFAGHCAVAGGAFATHCLDVTGAGCAPCPPDMTWNWADPAKPLSPDWGLVSEDDSPNGCVRHTTWDGADPNTADVKISTSQSGRTVDMTLDYGSTGMDCAYRLTLTWEGP